MNWKRRLLIGLFWACGLGAGLAALFAMREARAKAAREAQASGWATTTGRILWSTVRRVARHWPLPPAYARRINYSYDVGNIYYSSTRYSFDGDPEFSTEAAAKAGPKEGQELTVYYDPLRPGNAVANRSLHAFARSQAFNTAMVGLAMAEGLLLIVLARKIRPRRVQRPEVGGIRRT